MLDFEAIWRGLSFGRGGEARRRSVLFVTGFPCPFTRRFLRRALPEHLHVELPPLHILAGLLARDDNDEFRDLPARHPFVELGHDFLDVGLDLVVGGDEHVEAIFLHGCEVLSRVDPALEQDCVD